MKGTRSGHKNLLVNIVFACVLLSIMIGVVALHSSAQEADTPTPTDPPTDTPTVTPTDTPTATPTDTPAPTDTPVPTTTIEPTAMPSPSSSPTATASPTSDQGLPGPVSMPDYYIYPTATPEATAIPNATATILPSLNVTPEPTAAPETMNNTSAAIVNSGKGGNGINGSEILSLAAATLSIMAIIGCIAFYMNDKSRVPKMPKEPSQEDIYGLVMGGAYKRTRRPRS